MPISLNIDRPRPGGTENYVRHISKYLTERGARVIILCSGKGPSKTVARIRFIPAVRSANSEFVFIFRLFFALITGKVKLPSEDVLIHANAGHYCLPFVLPWKKRPVILNSNGARLPTLKAANKGGLYIKLFEHFVEVPVLRAVDGVIAVNEATQNYLLKKFPRLEGRIAFRKRLTISWEITL